MHGWPFVLDVASAIRLLVVRDHRDKRRSFPGDGATDE